jgi:hypothetical protein
MQPVHSLCFNAGGAIWYGAGNSFGWCWVDESFDGWNKDNPKPGKENMTTVMRWTGKADSLGNDIYEGDIMASRGNYITDECDNNGNFLDLYNVVVWNKKMTRFALKPIKEYLAHINNPPCSELDHPWVCSITTFKEVVGNVYQNPELLKS